MFEIESVNEKMVRIDDTYIPAVNIQIEGFPCNVDGVPYYIYFEILFEVEDHSWEVFEIPQGNILLEAIGPLGCIMDVKPFNSWTSFKEYYLENREDPYRGIWLERHLTDSFFI